MSISIASGKGRNRKNHHRDVDVADPHLWLQPKIVSDYRKMPVILHTAYARYKSGFMTWLADTFVLTSSGLSVLKKSGKELSAKKSCSNKSTSSSSKKPQGECQMVYITPKKSPDDE